MKDVLTFIWNFFIVIVMILGILILKDSHASWYAYIPFAIGLIIGACRIEYITH